MIAKAAGRFLRVSPRKTRIVMALVRGKNVKEALAILRNTNKKPASVIIKILNSAIANAKRLPNVHEEDLYISEIKADSGPMLKRYRAQSMGRAGMIKKRTSHITVVLGTIEKKISHKPQPPARRLKVEKQPAKEKAQKPKAGAKKPKTEKSSQKGAESGS
jgi:large subunit ribosomal protein L22